MRPSLARAVMAAALASAVGAQPAPEIDEQYQFWASLNSTTRVSDRLGAVADVHVRRNDFLADPSFHFTRVGVHAWLSEALTATLGYGHMWKAPAHEDWTTWSHENRAYQQLQLVSHGRRVQWTHRLRNEQRWQQQIEADAFTGRWLFTNRVRYLLSASAPLSERASALSLVVANEVALQFGADANWTFDQERLFVGLKRRLGGPWSVDAGYMLVYQQKSAGHDLNHTLRLFFYLTPDLRGRPADVHPAGDVE